MRNEEQKKSYKLYRVACERFQKYMKGDFPLIQLTPLHIQGFANTMKEEGLSATSVRIYLTLIRVILNYARRDLMDYDFKDRNCMRYVHHKTRNSKKSENEIAFTIQPEAQDIINKYISESGKLVFGKYSSYEKVYSLVFRAILDRLIQQMQVL